MPAEPVTDSLAFIRRHLAPLAGRRVLDVGCGKGGLAKALASDGALVTGVDPAADALAEARAAAPAATFERGGAEALPFADGRFDAAIFLNSLHHVPPRSMRQALAEARRVTKRGGLVLVVEPLVQGSFNDVLKLIDDETEIRALAQAALEEAAAGAGFESVESLTFTRAESFDGFDAFVVRATSADPSRNDVVARHRERIAQAFHRAAAHRDGRYWLDQRLKADALAHR